MLQKDYLSVMLMNMIIFAILRGVKEMCIAVETYVRHRLVCSSAC